MSFDVFGHGEHQVPAYDGNGAPRDVADVARDVASLPARAAFRLSGDPGLEPGHASRVFRALEDQDRPFVARLSIAAVEHKAVVEDAARAGCVAIEIEREGALIHGLATGLDESPAEFERAVGALRRVRGLGIATVARLPLGRDEDDEGIFERVLRFCRRALIAVPVVVAAGDGDEGSPAAAAGGRMEAESLANGIAWTRARLARHGAIWRRAFWPGGARRIALAAGYELRRAAVASRRGIYTRQMQLLHELNRTVRARARENFLMTLSGDRALAQGFAPRRAWLRVKAASDARVRALFIQVEGALDLRGARSLLTRVGEAVQAGYQRITIDVHGVEAVSRDVVSGFLAENKARLAEFAGCTRIVNLRGLLEALRQQLEDSEDLRLIEFAARA